MNPLSIPNIWLARPFLMPEAGLPASLRLSVGETIRALVLESNGSRAILDIGGHTVVAETMLTLQVGADLQLTVKGLQDGQFILQATPSRALPQPVSNADIGLLLRNLRLAEDDLNFSIVRELIRQGMELTGQNISAVRLGLLRSHAGPEHLERAIYLLQNEIPIAPGALQLLAPGASPTFSAGLWTQVLQALTAAIDAQERYRDRSDLNSLTHRLEEVLRGIDLRRDGADIYALAERLHRTLESAGTPIEARLLNLLQGGDDQDLDGNLRLVLAFVENEIARLKEGKSPGARQALEATGRAIEDLSKNLEMQQLLNAAELNSSAARKTYWLTIPLVVANETQSAVIRVDRDGCQEDDSQGSRQPGYPVRLMLDMSLSNLGPVRIDLCAWPERQLDCALRLGDAGSAGFVNSKGHILLESLQEAGFAVQKLECSVWESVSAGRCTDTLPAGKRADALKIDLKA